MTRTNPYYAGWDATGSAPSSSVGIHHPDGDIKKISVDNNLAVSSDFDPDPAPYPSNSQWKVVDWDKGTTEGGSSGSPLFDDNSQKIIGQLTGGYAACGNSSSDYYGKFSMSWDYGSSSSSRLKDWLDPNNTGIQQLDGIEGPTPLQVSISGPTSVNEGQTATWSGSISGGDGSYESVNWYKKFTDTPYWAFECIGTTSCTTSFQDANSQPDTGYLKFEVLDEGGRYFGEDVYSVGVIEYGGPYATSASDAAEHIPDAFTLRGNAPNPFTETTTIRFALPEATHVELTVWTSPGIVDILQLSNQTEAIMPRTRPPYPQQFREQMIALVRSGRSIPELAKEFEPTAQTIRNWIKQADLDDGVRSDGLTTEEREELKRLRKENRRLQQERDILSKAAAWFARETKSIPKQSSNS